MVGSLLLRPVSRAGGLAIVLNCLLAGQDLAAAPPGVPTQAVVEQGSFRLHKFAQAIGEETYQIRKDGRAFELESNFKFTDRGTAVPLTARLTFDADLTPRHFQVKGSSSRFNLIDDQVSVAAHTVRVSQGTSEATSARPRRFFTISGYAPAAMQMLLLRYWRAHGSPERLSIFPVGEVRIERRGKDTVATASGRIVLERFIVNGLIWGREALWLDAKHQLIAIVSIDAELDHFEAVREGYEPALPLLLASAGRDEMAALAQIGRNFSGRRGGKLAFVGGTLVDGTGREAITDATVVIDADRIVAAGRREAVNVPADATVIDTTGKTLLPGLWDMHAHVEQVEWGPIYLAAGITSVRDCGNEFEFIVAVRDAIRSGRGLGPRLMLAGLVDGSGPKSLGVQRVDTPADAQSWVMRYHNAGFEQMKIYSSMTRENVQAVATAAHQAGMSVTGHVPDGMSLVEAVGAGMDQINHLSYVAVAMAPGDAQQKLSRTEAAARIAAIDVHSPRALEIIELLKAHATVVDPTVTLREPLSSALEPGINKVAPELAAQFLPAPDADPNTQTRPVRLQRELDIIGALHAAGIPIVAGTDQGVPGYSLYRELELYVEAGMTPMDAIRAATAVPAKVMGLDQELGTVEAGKKADLIVLGANPLESIHNIRTVEKVVAAGTLFETAPLWESVGFKP